MQKVIDKLFSLTLALDLVCRGTNDEGAREVIIMTKQELWAAAQRLDDLDGGRLTRQETH